MASECDSPCKNIDLSPSNSILKAMDTYERIRKVLSDSISDKQVVRLIGQTKISDEESFIERLSSYLSFQWSVKPRCVSPPICASYGWKVIERDLLECVSCKQLLCAELPPVWQNRPHEKALLSLIESIKEKHHKFCPWPLSGGKDNYLHKTFLNTETMMEMFYSRLKSLNDIKDQLPEVISSNLPENLKCIEYLLEKGSLSNWSETSEVCLTALQLTICGWQTKLISDECHRLFCSNCMRTIELSSYVTRSRSDATQVIERLTPSSNMNASSDDEEICLKRKKYNDLQIQGLNPLDEHHRWCPWVDTNYKSVTSDGESSNLREGWKVFLDGIESFIQNSQDAKTTSKYISPRSGILESKKIMKLWIKDF